MSKQAERERLERSLREALAELEGVFGDLVRTAEEKSCLRCPYMNIRRECTAEFSCINQVFVPGVFPPGSPRGERVFPPGSPRGERVFPPGSPRGERVRPLCSGQHRINFSSGRPVPCPADHKPERGPPAEPAR